MSAARARVRRAAPRMPRRGSETLLTLVRHGETDWNRERRIQGSSDVPLNEVGVAQARAAGAALADAGYAAVYSSPQSRAFETARIVSEAIGAPLSGTFADLRERSFGAAEGMTGPEIAARFPDGIPDEETRDDVVSRSLPVLHRIARRHPGGAVLVVTHGAVISSLVRHLTGGTLPKPGEGIMNLSLTHLVHTRDGLELGEFNVPSHDAQRIADSVLLESQPSDQDVASAAAADTTSSSTASSAAADPAQV